MHELNLKWKDNKLKLYEDYYDSTKSLEENLRNIPLGITQTDWALYIQYRIEETTKVL